MRYMIDCDGVVAAFVPAFVREVNNLYPGKLPVDYIQTNWDFSPDLTKEEVSRTWAMLEKKPNWWLSLHGYPENVRAIALHRIRHPEDEIFYITARHEVAGMPAMHQTQTWLQQCGIGGLGTSVIVDNSGSKVDIINALECDASVDDKLEAVIEHTNRTKGAYLLDRPWNQQGRPSGILSVVNLDEFFRRATASGGKSARV